MRAKNRSKMSQSILGNDGLDLNPMLDVVFILVVFFVVTATFVQEAGLPEYSGASSNSFGAPPAITIDINYLGEFTIDGQVVSKKAIRAHVQRALSKHQNRDAVILMADSNAPVSSYIDAVDEIRMISMNNISFQLKEGKR